MSPKITVHGGATNARDADVSPAAVASQPLIEAEVDQGRPTTDDVQNETVPEVDETQNETPDESAVPADRYDEMTIADLRSEVATRGLATRGTRQQIIARLREADTV